MTLQECLDRLARGKISNLSICEKGKIKEQALPRVIDALNEALLRLYTVLPLKQNSLIIKLYEGRTEYPLTSAHSITLLEGNRYDPYKYYVMDTLENPFLDDIINIEEVFDDLNRHRPLNDPTCSLSVYTPQHNFISTPISPTGRLLNIIYRAKHTVITPMDLLCEIDIPDNLQGALLSYVAYMLHSTLNTELAVQNSQKYLAEYQSIVNEVIQNGTITPDKLVNGIKFFKRGFV